MDGKVKAFTTLAIGLLVLLVISATTIPEAMDAGDELNQSANCDWNGTAYVDCGQLPLAGIFTSGGVIFVLIVAGLFYGVYKAVSKK